jgi:predicted nucleic acid-binding Zn ribbon protein
MPSISRIRDFGPRAGKSRGFRRLEAYLSPEVRGELQRRQDWAQRLISAWQGEIGSPLAEYTRPLSYQAGKLTVLAQSPVWAGRLRQQQRRLLRALRRQPLFEGLLELKIRAVPSLTPRATARSRPGGRDLLSPASAALIEAVAQEIPDADLSDALKRLATRR